MHRCCPWLAQPLRYAQAASAVRACAYKLEAPVAAGELPFVASKGARQINDILATGTCEELENFRWGERAGSPSLKRGPADARLSVGPCNCPEGAGALLALLATEGAEGSRARLPSGPARPRSAGGTGR